MYSEFSAEFLDSLDLVGFFPYLMLLTHTRALVSVYFNITDSGLPSNTNNHIVSGNFQLFDILKFMYTQNMDNL